MTQMDPGRAPRGIGPPYEMIGGERVYTYEPAREGGAAVEVAIFAPHGGRVRRRGFGATKAEALAAARPCVPFAAVERVKHQVATNYELAYAIACVAEAEGIEEEALAAAYQREVGGVR